MITLLGIFSKAIKTYVQKNTFTIMFIATLFIISQTGGNPNVHTVK